MARFIILWLASLPFVLVDQLCPPLAVPLVVLAESWALYSTEELAKLLDEPFGRVSKCGGEASASALPWQPTCGVPEAVPVEAYWCSSRPTSLTYPLFVLPSPLSSPCLYLSRRGVGGDSKLAFRSHMELKQGTVNSPTLG